MLASDATAARIASEPEWQYVPSPRLAKTCWASVNGAWPSQVTPSAPICVKVAVLRSIQTAMKWQPMPASARLPSGTLVDGLCGHPKQKYGVGLKVDDLAASARSFASMMAMRSSIRGEVQNLRMRAAIALAI